MSAAGHRVGAPTPEPSGGTRQLAGELAYGIAHSAGLLPARYDRHTQPVEAEDISTRKRLRCF